MTFKQFLAETQHTKVRGTGGLAMPTKKDKEKKRQQKHGGAKKDTWKQYAD